MENYLLVGAHPTPNGPLHIGHISGPYLSLDLFARVNRLLLNNVYFIMGVDSFETHVLSSANAENKTSKEIVDKYSTAIKDNLSKMNISLDNFIGLHEESYKNIYHKFHDKTINQLEQDDRILFKDSFVGHDYKLGPIIGCWSEGKCPFCLSKMTGFYCENCFSFVPTEELIDSNIDNNNGNTIQLKYVKWSKEEISYSTSKASFVNFDVDLFLQNQEERKYLCQITIPGQFGIKSSDNNQVFFTYTIGVLSYYLTCMKIYEEKFTTKFGDYKIITAFGVDNLPCFIFGLLPLMKVSKKTIPDIDFYVNNFLKLDNSKFSTRKNHAIWVDKIIEDGVINIDILRLYLVKISPMDGESNFDLRTFVEYYNGIVQILNGFEDSIMQLDNVSSPDCVKEIFFIPNTDNLLNFKLIHENILSRINNFATNKIISPHFALMLYPIMPKIGYEIWENFYPNQPINCADISESALPLPEKFSWHNKFEMLDYDYMRSLVGER